MKTHAFFSQINSSKLLENFEKQFGARVNLSKYTREELEDMRNKLRTRVFQHEGSSGYNELLTKEAYQKDKAMLQILNTRINEMLGENLKQLRDKMVELSEAKKPANDPTSATKTTKSKPDFLDLDNDGDKTEPMKAATKHKKVKASDDIEEGSCNSAAKDSSMSKKTAPVKTRKETKTSESSAKPSAGMTKKAKSAVVKKARAGGDIGKPGKNFNKVVKSAKKGGARDPKAVAAAAMWKQQAKESFKRSVAIVNESLTRMINEDEEGKAKTITAASDIVNDFTSWMQRVGQYQTKALIELADAIRADFGLQQSEQFKTAVAPALAGTLETLTQQREAISNAVAVLAGEDIPQEQMGMEPESGMGDNMDMGSEMEPTGPDLMNEPGDEFGASDAAAGAGSAGREMRESQFARKLAESHSIMFKLAK